MSSAVLLRARVLSHGGRQVIAQDSGCHSKLSARLPTRIARRVTSKEREELLLESRVQRELRAVPAVSAAALGVLRLVVVEAHTSSDAHSSPFAHCLLTA